MRIGVALAVVALPMAFATACGDSDETATETPTSAGSPSSPPQTPDDPTSSAATEPTAPSGMKSCASVWQVGHQLPRSYDGCSDDGVLVEADRLSCSSGQTLVRYDDHFFGVAGGTIFRARRLNTDQRYLEMIGSCRG